MYSQDTDVTLNKKMGVFWCVQLSAGLETQAWLFAEFLCFCLHKWFPQMVERWKPYSHPSFFSTHDHGCCLGGELRRTQEGTAASSRSCIDKIRQLHAWCHIPKDRGTATSSSEQPETPWFGSKVRAVVQMPDCRQDHRVLGQTSWPCGGHCLVVVVRDSVQDETSSMPDSRHQGKKIKSKAALNALAVWKLDMLSHPLWEFLLS